MKEKGTCAPTFNHRLSALSFFFSVTCDRSEMKRYLRYQREAKKIPVVLSPREIAQILAAAPGPGLKYSAALSAAYGCGLRANEVTHLKVSDIDSDRMLIRVEHGKDRKDRQVMLSPHLLDLLRSYYRESRPAGWLFPGRNPADPVSNRQLSRAFHAACDFAGIRKNVFPPHSAAQFRDPLAGKRNRHSGDPGTAWPLRLGNHDRLHQCGGQDDPGRDEPAGSAEPREGQKQLTEGLRVPVVTRSR